MLCIFVTGRSFHRAGGKLQQVAGLYAVEQIVFLHLGCVLAAQLFRTGIHHAVNVENVLFLLCRIGTHIQRLHAHEEGLLGTVGIINGNLGAAVFKLCNGFGIRAGINTLRRDVAFHIGNRRTLGVGQRAFHAQLLPAADTVGDALDLLASAPVLYSQALEGKRKVVGHAQTSHRLVHVGGQAFSLRSLGGQIFAQEPPAQILRHQVLGLRTAVDLCMTHQIRLERTGRTIPRAHTGTHPPDTVADGTHFHGNRATAVAGNIIDKAGIPIVLHVAAFQHDGCFQRIEVIGVEAALIGAVGRLTGNLIKEAAAHVGYKNIVHTLEVAARGTLLMGCRGGTEHAADTAFQRMLAQFRELDDFIVPDHVGAGIVMAGMHQTDLGNILENREFRGLCVHVGSQGKGTVMAQTLIRHGRHKR